MSYVHCSKTNLGVIAFMDVKVPVLIMSGLLSGDDHCCVMRWSHVGLLVNFWHEMAILHGCG